VRRIVFVDTSAWYALVGSDDACHSKAADRMKQLTSNRDVAFTTNYVVSEAYTLMRIRLGASVAHEFLRRTRDSNLTQRYFFPESWEGSAEDLLFQYRDQDFSYVDATSFVTMRRLGIHEALAFDHHCAVLGFVLYAER
jgi:predicted nucleic acid-binding protein